MALCGDAVMKYINTNIAQFGPFGAANFHYFFVWVV